MALTSAKREMQLRSEPLGGEAVVGFPHFTRNRHEPSFPRTDSAVHSPCSKVRPSTNHRGAEIMCRPQRRSPSRQPRPGLRTEKIDRCSLRGLGGGGYTVQVKRLIQLAAAGSLVVACGDSGDGEPSDCALVAGVCQEDEYCDSPSCPSETEEEVGVCRKKDAGTFQCGSGLCDVATEMCIDQLTSFECVPRHCEPLPPSCASCGCIGDNAECSVASCSQSEEGGIKVTCDG